MITPDKLQNLYVLNSIKCKFFVSVLFVFQKKLIIILKEVLKGGFYENCHLEAFIFTILKSFFFLLIYSHRRKKNKLDFSSSHLKIKDKVFLSWLSPLFLFIFPATLSDHLSLTKTHCSQYK